MKPQPTRYNVYVAALDWVDGNATDPLFIIDADSMVVIDSITHVGLLYDMEVSPDGRSLYAYVHLPGLECPGDSLRCIDITSKKVRWTIPSGPNTRLSILENGRLLLRSWEGCSGQPDGRDLIDANTGQIARTLPDSLRYGSGPIVSTNIAAIVGDSLGAPVVAMDVMSGDAYGHFVPRSPSGQPLVATFARLHEDGQTVLVVAGVVTDVAWAIIGNVATGEQLVAQRIYNIYGVGEFSADGSLAVVSAMNTGIAAFDLDSSMVLHTPAVGGGQVEFIGETENVVTCGFGDYFHASNPLWTVDVRSSTVIATLQLPLPEPLLGAMAVGRKP